MGVMWLQQMLRSLQGQYRFSQAYSKFRISRSPQESMIFFFQNEVTVGRLLDTIKQNFPVQSSTLLAASAFDAALIGYPILPQAQKATASLSEQLLLPLLVSGELFVYEGVAGRVQGCFGIDCEQFNPTNNRNLPEHIANSVIDLNSDWLNARTLQDALLPPLLPDPNAKQLIEEREEVRGGIQKAHMRLLQLSKFTGEYSAGSPTHTFTVRMAALMSLNWACLFAITYGKYGWDVGEPVSYLTGLGVDLLAMGGVFDLQRQLQEKVAQEDQRWGAMLNIQAQKRAQAWLLSYHRRQYY